MICAVDGCDRPTQAHGLCGRHYQISRRQARTPADVMCGDCGQWVGTARSSSAAWDAYDAHTCGIVCGSLGPHGARCDIRTGHVGQHGGMDRTGEWRQWL